MGVRLRPGSVLHLHSQSPKNVSPRKLCAIKKGAPKFRMRMPNHRAGKSLFLPPSAPNEPEVMFCIRVTTMIFMEGDIIFFPLLPRFIPFLEKLLGI